MERLTSVEMHQTKQELRSLFDEVDTDNSGYISNKELRDFLRNKHHKLPQHVLNEIYKNADENGDDRLDLKEFTNMVYDPRYKGFFLDLFKKYVDFILPRYNRTQSVESQGDRRDQYVKLMTCWPPPLVMVVISIIMIILFAIDAANGNTDGKGTIAQSLIFDPDKRYEIWRYMTYMFVHVGYVHLIMNLVIQIMWGIFLEAFHSWWRVLLIYDAGILAGSLGAFVFDSFHQLAGASGGVYSLITAHVATIILNWSEMRFPLTNLMIFFAFATADLIYVFYFNDPCIGHTTHFCGALAGLLVGVLILRNISLNRRERILQIVALVFYIGLMGSAIIWNIAR